MKKCISVFLPIILCLLLNSCYADNPEQINDSKVTVEYFHVEPPPRTYWKSFDEISTLKNISEQKNEQEILDYLVNGEHYYATYGFYSKEDVNNFFEQICQLTTLSLDENCNLKLYYIQYNWDYSSLLIHYQEGSGLTFKRRVTFSIYPTRDGHFTEFSDHLSEFTVIDSIDIESNQIDLYATGSYESKYSNVMCSRGCFETDNSYIIISYDTVDESAVLDPCIKDCLQITSLNKLIG